MKRALSGTQVLAEKDVVGSPHGHEPNFLTFRPFHYHFYIKPLLFAMCFFAEIFELVPLSQAFVILGMDHFMRALAEEYT